MKRVKNGGPRNLQNVSAHLTSVTHDCERLNLSKQAIWKCVENKRSEHDDCRKPKKLSSMETGIFRSFDRHTGDFSRIFPFSLLAFQSVFGCARVGPSQYSLSSAPSRICLARMASVKPMPQLAQGVVISPMKPASNMPAIRTATTACRRHCDLLFTCCLRAGHRSAGRAWTQICPVQSARYRKSLASFP